jgi:hypothetical protein
MLAIATTKEALQGLLGIDVSTSLGARENKSIQLALLT